MNETEIQKLFCNDNCNNLTTLIENLENFFNNNNNNNSSNLKELDLINKTYFEEIKEMVNNNSCVNVYFGKSLGELKCVTCDNEGLRKHEIYLKCTGPKKYVISSVNLPFFSYQDKEYNSFDEIIHKFENHINCLSNYFKELDSIDHLCAVVEPLKPTYKDDYRKICLDNRTWLHVEVTPDGTATNIHLIGQSELWHDKLQKGLLSWDHDKNIVDNIMHIFDISNVSSTLDRIITPQHEFASVAEKQICGICLCHELTDISGVPQPLCQNNTCGVYFHRSCLFEWLVACSGGRPPAFGVATGSCPTCLYPISCGEKEDRMCK